MKAPNEVERCEVCDWPYSQTGCQPGSCAYRPAEGTEEYRRVQERRRKLGVDQLQPTPAEPRIESVPDERAELSRDDYHESQIQQEFMQARTNNGAIWQFWLHRQLVLARKRLAILQFDGRARAGSSLIVGVNGLCPIGHAGTGEKENL